MESTHLHFHNNHDTLLPDCSYWLAKNHHKPSCSILPQSLYEIWTDWNLSSCISADFPERIKWRPKEIDGTEVWKAKWKQQTVGDATNGWEVVRVSWVDRDYDQWWIFYCIIVITANMSRNTKSGQEDRGKAGNRNNINIQINFNNNYQKFIAKQQQA